MGGPFTLPPEGEPRVPGDPAPRRSYFQRRADKIVAEIQANRRGEYTVPTWVLALALVAMIVGVLVLLSL